MHKSVDQEFHDRIEWRKWLEKNHNSENEIWVIIQKNKSERKGVKYQESVEEIIAHELLNSTKGERGILHGSGREDIDALMLGTGRPFVIEIENPIKRSIDLVEIEQKINQYAKKKVDVQQLRWSNKKEVVYLKTQAQQAIKKYRAYVKFDSEISDELIKHIEKKFKNIELNQRTPQRVKHRRADITRNKTVFTIKCKRINQIELEANIKCSGGTYVKELISGDNGRTEPSFTSETGIQAICKQLDVLEIQEKEFKNHI